MKKIIQYKISSHILFLESSHTQRNTEKSNAIDCSKKTFRPHKPIATMRKTSHVSQQQIFSGNCIFHIPTKSTPLGACSSRYADSHKSPQISSKYMTSHYRTYYWRHNKLQYNDYMSVSSTEAKVNACFT